MQVNILNTRVDILNMAEAVEKISGFVAQAVPKRVVTANPELIYRAAKDEKLRSLIDSADLVTADGVGVVWAAKVLRNTPAERVTGIDLVTALLPKANSGSWRIFLLGSAPGVAAEALRKIQLAFPLIQGESCHGYFQPGSEESAVLEKIKQYKPDILLVGLGAPRQEEWIANNYRELKVPVSIGIGGSFDVLSGRIKRAPNWVRALKLEWFSRLVKEPQRAKRQLVLPKFALMVLASKYLSYPRKN